MLKQKFNFLDAMFVNLVKRSVSSISVIGAGSMGSGIAQVSAQAGIQVNLIDLDQKSLQRATSTIDKSVSRIVKKKFKDNESAGKDFKDKIMTNIEGGVVLIVIYYNYK